METKRIPILGIERVNMKNGVCTLSGILCVLLLSGCAGRQPVEHTQTPQVAQTQSPQDQGDNAPSGIEHDVDIPDEAVDFGE